MKAIRVFVVEDQPTMLKSLTRLFSQSKVVEVIGSALSAEEAVQAINRLPKLPDVLLSDVQLPGMSGIDLCRWSRTKYPEIEVLMLTVSEDESRVLEAVRKGAAGYLVKGVSGAKLIEAIQEIQAGGSIIQPALAKRLLSHFQAHPEESPEKVRGGLTERELECLQMIAKGLSNNEAANVMGLSRATVRTHLEHIYQKLDVCNRVEAVTEGLRQGLIGI